MAYATHACLAFLCIMSAVSAQNLLFFDATQAPPDVASQYELPHLLAALSGLSNRQGPVFYYAWTVSDLPWLKYLQQPGGWLAGHTLQTVPTVEQLVAALRDYFSGVVLYDPAVAQTAVVASTVAGADNLLPICYRPNDPSSLYNRLVAGGPQLPVNISLVGLFTGNVSGSAKYDAVSWARTRYLDTGRSNASVLAYYIDYFWTQVGGVLCVCCRLHCLRAFCVAGDCERCVSAQVANVAPWQGNTVGNHDYFISKRAFFFDLSPWADEAPNDDPHQPLGTDVRALNEVMHSAYTACGGCMIHVGGFVPWPYKCG
jgi:hypothetical protein